MRFVTNRKRLPPSGGSQPHVGIFYLVGSKLLIDSTPIDRAGSWGEFAVHEPSHLKYWARLTKAHLVLGGEYEEHPRGRVGYNTRTREYLLLADNCILRKKNLVRTIMRRMNLPADSKIETDSHYRCYHCLRNDS